MPNAQGVLPLPSSPTWYLDPGNNGLPDGGGVFKSPDTHNVRMPPERRSETTKEGPTVMVKKETTTPGASYGGDEQEAAGR
ncbi:hypothetical protein NDU88_002578 [Pleurodeles waltl]|uniref:Uncharacterized protein n=1 Tax=Pleurodeles waltl TaxID=8319 RepID=A0AAV7LCX0_PLEWA|nr:hypothetical protein NDU88_002578 [Pleurodeles waltl]